MDLTLILGPMKSGKSFELINHFAPLRYTTVTHQLFQPLRNVRDERISSRNGVTLEAKKVHTLKDVLSLNIGVIGIDEIHMFPVSEGDIIEELIRQGKRVIVSGLDTDYRGHMFPIIRRLFEIGPKEVRYKRAACDQCRRFDATHTQILLNGTPIVDGLPSVVPDDGTYSYSAVCRDCFVRPTPTELLSSTSL